MTVDEMMNLRRRATTAPTDRVVGRLGLRIRVIDPYRDHVAGVRMPPG
ncbi:hypothetical protein [Rhodococcus olei]